MQNRRLFALFLFLLLGLISMAVSIIPNLVSEELKVWCEAQLGPNYLWYLGGVFVIGSFLLLILSGNFTGLFGRKAEKITFQLKRIPWTKDAEESIRKALENIGQAYQREALEAIMDIDHSYIQEQATLLLAQWNEYEKEIRMAILSSEQKDVRLNRLNKSILDLVSEVERLLEKGNEEILKIRKSLQESYEVRLGQKLAGRHPVNLRLYVSTEGTSARVAATFIPFRGSEVGEKMSEVFYEAYGRLLLVGQPGAGKTTLLLQLAEQLLELEVDAVPLVLNLATWRTDYGNLENWLEAALVDELGTNKASAQLLLQQVELILLLDGMDELREKEVMDSCLKAIALYGSKPRRRFVITSRIDEYKRVGEDARVNLQIEVGPLSQEQLQVELRRLVEMTPRQPEAFPLLNDLQTDPFLREALQTPFYINTAQLLYAGRLPEFHAADTEGRKTEIVEKFVSYALHNAQDITYPPPKIRHWLSFLAVRMGQHQKAVFELRDLQYDWWGYWSRYEKITTQLVFGLVLGLRLGLACGLLLPLFIGLTGVGVGFLVFLLVWLWHQVSFWGGGIQSRLENPLSISTKNVTTLSLRNYWKYLKENSCMLLIFGLPFGLIFFSAILLIFGMVFLPIFGFHSTLAELSHVLLYWLIAWSVILFLLLPIFSFWEMIDGDSGFTRINKPYQRFTDSVWVLYFSILQHFHLRWLLYKKGLLPWDMVNFLNEMTKRNLFEVDGATWRFRHQIIQDYFAEKWSELEQEGDLSNPNGQQPLPRQ